MLKILLSIASFSCFLETENYRQLLRGLKCFLSVTCNQQTMFDIYILLENKCFLIIITGTFIYVKLRILTLTFIVLFLSVLIPLSHIFKIN